MPTSRVEIDLSAVGHNAGVIRRVLGKGVMLCAVLKQDAYGLGAPRLARRLSAGGADMFAVYNLDEARQLIDAAVPTPILVLMPVRSIDRMDPVYRHAFAGKLHLVVHDRDQLASLEEIALRLGISLPIHVQLDTGLARGGALPDEAASLVQTVARIPRMRLAGVMTHFASPCTDAQFTREQARQFEQWRQRLAPVLQTAAGTGIAGIVAPGAAKSPDLLVHSANSCATFRSREYHGSMVRIGQALYGYVVEGAGGGPPRTGQPAQDAQDRFEFATQAMELRPAVRWTSSIVHVKEVPAGFPVGYGSTWRATRPTRIALVPVGYADGYPRSIGSAGVVGLTGRQWDRTGSAGGGGAVPPPTTSLKTAPIIGRVSMDQITIDVTDMPEPWRRIGAEVEIVGPSRQSPNHFPRLAESAGTITHELLCRIGPRVERAYRFPAASAGGAEGPVRVLTTRHHEDTAGGGLADGAVARQREPRRPPRSSATA